MLTVVIFQLPALRSFLPGEYPATELTQFLGSSLYSPGADPTENTTLNSFYIAMDGYLAIARIMLMCLSAVTKQRLLSLFCFEVFAYQRVYTPQY
jgi:hypothetical protein